MGFKSIDFSSSRSAEAVQTTPKQMAKPAIRLEGPGRAAESVDVGGLLTLELGKSGGGFSTARLNDQSAKFANDFFGKIQFVKSHQLEPEESVLRKIGRYSSPWIFVGDLRCDLQLKPKAEVWKQKCQLPVPDEPQAEQCWIQWNPIFASAATQKRMLKHSETSLLVTWHG